MPSKKVEKLVLLVHPGAVGEYEREEEEYTSQEVDLLLGKYRSKAKEMLETEVMVVYPWQSENEFKKSEKPSKQFIEELCRILEDRILVIFSKPLAQSDETIMRSGSELSPILLEDTFVARGYDWNPDEIKSEVMGETIGCCVEDWAEQLNIELGLSSKTDVLVQFTDACIGADALSQHQVEMPNKPLMWSRLNWVE